MSLDVIPWANQYLSTMHQPSQRRRPRICPSGDQRSLAGGIEFLARRLTPRPPLRFQFSAFLSLSFAGALGVRQSLSVLLAKPEMRCTLYHHIPSKNTDETFQHFPLFADNQAASEAQPWIRWPARARGIAPKVIQTEDTDVSSAATSLAAQGGNSARCTYYGFGRGPNLPCSQNFPSVAASWSGIQGLAVRTYYATPCFPRAVARKLARGNIRATRTSEDDGQRDGGVIWERRDAGKVSINEMVKRLGNFSSEVIHAAPEVRTYRKLGGEAEVGGVRWPTEDLADDDDANTVAYGYLEKTKDVDVSGETIPPSDYDRVGRSLGELARRGVQGIWKNLTNNTNFDASRTLRFLTCRVKLNLASHHPIAFSAARHRQHGPNLS
ncbi:hypothetical protein DFH06DRAFT_1140298 [Mycena polygramma]|nr:hypothetical protein DFH06DRAFT_1140298 [Mycena polygramma]